jgi:rubrerythrin
VKALTVQEIFSYAIKIEQESYLFYKTAAEHMTNQDSVHVLQDLAREEVQHIDVLHKLQALEPADKGESKRNAISSATEQMPIIEYPDIAGTMDPVELFQVALERERQTEQLYGMFEELSKMDERIADTFSTLREQELLHVRRIEGLLS